MPVTEGQIVTHRLYADKPVDAPRGLVIWREETRWMGGRRSVECGVRWADGHGGLTGEMRIHEPELIPHPSQDHAP